MKMFEMLDELHKKSNENYIVPVEEPKICRDKTTDIKNYKRNYYLQNLQIYKERNDAYRKKQKELKELNKNIL
jgi:hypothetical protein